MTLTPEVTSTLERIVEITRSVEEDSEPWRFIAAHSTDSEGHGWPGLGYQMGSTTHDQDWFWTSEWQRGEYEASLDIEGGQLSRTLKSEAEIRQYMGEL